MATFELPPELFALAHQLQALRAKAEAVGLFLDDRELLDCTGCGLQEDVTGSGRLITHEHDSPEAPDSGLRFTDLGDRQFRCPRCMTMLEARGFD